MTAGINHINLIATRTHIEPAGKALQDGLEELGVRFHLGAVVNTLTRQDSGVKAELSNGTTIEADLVVSAIGLDRKSTRLNSSHVRISYAVFCLKKKKK